MNNNEILRDILKKSMGIDNISEEELIELRDTITPIINSIKPVINNLLKAISDYMDSEEFVLLAIAEISKPENLSQIFKHDKINHSNRP